MTDAPPIFTPSGRANPYRIEGPALISVSGGRTSGFMLRKIMDAHGGKLPGNVLPVFLNTGREVEATLVFLREMQERWQCPIWWVEYRYADRPDGGKFHTFEVVDYCTASRKGEPFEQLIAARSYVPNPVTRFCTVELKIRTAERFARSLGWGEYANCVGLRADEPRRVAKMKGDTKSENVVMPMAEAGVTKADVLAFWREQSFDLQLPGDDNAFGNCDLCFLKGRDKIEKVMRATPKSADWWARQEEAVGGTFRRDRPTYRQMVTQLTVQGQMFDDAIEDDTLPCQCTD